VDAIDNGLMGTNTSATAGNIISPINAIEFNGRCGSTRHLFSITYIIMQVHSCSDWVERLNFVGEGEVETNKN
jgi:hypothetical protein